VLTNDIFGNGELAYEATDAKLKDWLEEFFGPTTTAARKNQMREAEPVLAALFTGRKEIPVTTATCSRQGVVYTLNQRMVHRTTMPKGASAYPRPLLTANFALLEAKRLLNIMDYALLQGGTNYIVIAKQGSDKLPAQQPEIDNLMEQVRSRHGPASSSATTGSPSRSSRRTWSRCSTRPSARCSAASWRCCSCASRSRSRTTRATRARSRSWSSPVPHDHLGPA
jgi:hypothetical protein